MSSDYDKYLKSTEWQVRRELIKSRDHYKCRLCHSTDKIKVHHATYENQGNERDIDLVTLCSSCHSTFHGCSHEDVQVRSTRRLRRPPRPRRPPPPQEAPRQDEVVKLLKAAGGPLTVRAICQGLDIKHNACSQILFRMRRKGLIGRLGRGVYQLTLSGGVP